MHQKIILLLLVVGLAPTDGLSQNVGKISGTVRDASTGEPLSGTTIVVEGSGLGAAADRDGEYFIMAVPVGSYTVRASFIGFDSISFDGVEINHGFTRRLDFNLHPRTKMHEGIVVEYEKPLIQKDAIGTPKVLTSEEIGNLPVRGIDAVAALQGGVLTDASGELHFRGGRPDEIVYFVDGVKVVGGTSVPQHAIREQEMLIGSLPAKYGDALSGVVSVTTKSGGQDFFGSLEGITSSGLDDYGYNLGAASIGGPLLKDRLSFFAAAEYTHMDDRQPSAIDIPRLRSDRLEALQRNPQVLRFKDVEGDKIFLPMPVGFAGPTFTLEDVLGVMDVPEGLALDSPTPISAAEVEPLSSYEFSGERPGYFLDNLTLTGNVTYAEVRGVSIRLTGRYETSRRAILNQQSLDRMIFNDDRLEEREDEIFDTGLAWTHRISGSTFYQIQAEYGQTVWSDFDPFFSTDVRDLYSYGDIGHPANVGAARYVTWNAADSTYRPRFKDGSLPSSRGLFGIFSEIGRGVNLFGRGESDRLRITANATTQAGPHQIEFGGEFERRSERQFWMNPFSLAESDATLYDYLPFSAVKGIVEYVGYDYLGLNTTDRGDIDSFVLGITGSCNEATGRVDPLCDSPPYKPILYAGYLQDKIELNDLILNVGLRVDVFDANTVVLRDPYALLPIVRAGELSDIPENIGPEYAVYFDHNDAVAGYRNSEGKTFNRNGEATDAFVLASNARPRMIGSGRMSSELFEDYEPAVIWMPRIGVSFPVTDRSLFFAHYDMTSQQPKDVIFPSLNEYRLATEGPEFLGNPALRPQRTTEYELGFRTRVGSRSALLISGFYRDIDDLIQFQWRGPSFPSNYRTLGNNDFGTVKGIQFEVDLRRSRGFSANANYTLQFSRGTGSDLFSSARTFPVPDFIFPLSFDQRHAINVNFDYRLGQGEGPSLARLRVLENFGLNVVASFRSGRPYTEKTWPSREVLGALNEDRMPWTSLVNLRLDRRFPLLSGHEMTFFLWVQNLFDVDNTVGVHPTTGIPDDDGFLLTDEGRRYLQDREISVCGSGCGGEVATLTSAVYGFRMNNPFHYGIPRLTRLGLRVNF